MWDAVIKKGLEENIRADVKTEEMLNGTNLSIHKINKEKYTNLT